MAWTCIYEDLSEKTEATAPADLPLDGLQAVIVDGKPYAGFNTLIFQKKTGDWQISVSRETKQEVLSRDPTATVIEGKTTSTAQFHKIEKRIGLWSPLNKEPFEGWMKDIIGWRLWTDTEVFEGRLPDNTWVEQWKTIPDRVQGVMVYENWKSTPTSDYRTYFGGLDRYYIAPSPFGTIIGNSNEDPAVILGRYPGAAIREGTLLSDEDYAPIDAAMHAAKEL